MAAPHPFRLAVEAKDLEAAKATLREDVVLHSPILFRGFEGREIVTQVLTHVAATLEDFRYTDELADERTVVLRFKARVGDRELEGIDFLELDEQGLVTGADRLHAPALGPHRLQRADGRPPRRRDLTCR